MERVCTELLDNIQNETLKRYYLSKKDGKKESPYYILPRHRSDFDREQPNSGFDKKVNLAFLVVLISFCIEISSCFDFFSDLLIILALANSTDTAWFSFSLFTVLAPYYTIYSSLINQLIKMIRASQKKSSRTYSSLAMNYLIILPTMLVMLIIIDIFYMCLSVVVYPILLPLTPCDIGHKMLESYEDSQNIVLYKLFGLSHMEICGFRS